jgi:hypothetical protein
MLQIGITNSTPSRLNGVCGQISSTVPFNKVTTIDYFGEFTLVLERFKRFVLKVGGPTSKTSNTTILSNNSQYPVWLHLKFSDSH